MQFGCQQPLLVGGALRDSPKNGRAGDYRFPERVQFNFILATFGDGGSLLSGFRSGHNFWTLLSVGGRALLSEFYGRRQLRNIYLMCQKILFIYFVLFALMFRSKLKHEELKSLCCFPTMMKLSIS